MRSIRIGTRGSRLALWQADYVERRLAAMHPGIRCEIIVIKTEGDRDRQSSLADIGGLGVFTKAIEEALSDGRVDIAVHSLKDLPSTMAPGLTLGAVPKRGSVEDVLITLDGRALAELPPGAVVATGSIRRRSQILHARPDIAIADLRGNVDTRLSKLKERDCDAVVMALAAIERLDLRHVRYSRFSTDEMTPAVGQGALGIQIRSGDSLASAVVEKLSHKLSLTAVVAERAFLRELDSGCRFPVGACARVEKGVLTMSGFVGSIDGRTVLRDTVSDDPAEAESLGRRLSRRFVERGALEILKRTHG